MDGLGSQEKERMLARRERSYPSAASVTDARLLPVNHARTHEMVSSDDY